MTMHYLNYKNVGQIVLLGVLCGCSAGKTYREIDPEAAAKDERATNGYYSLKAANNGKARIVLRSEKRPYGVNFSSSSSTTSCQDFKTIGNVMDAGHGVVYPWIAKLSSKMTRSKTFIEADIEPNESIQIRGYGSWVNDDTFFITRGNCGPITSTFTPAADHAYLVQFIWDGNACSQVISDATNPDSPIPLPVETVFSCPKP